MSKPFPRLADEAIDLLVDNGFATLEGAVYSVASSVRFDAEYPSPTTLRGWIESICKWEGTSFVALEPFTKHWRSTESTVLPSGDRDEHRALRLRLSSYSRLRVEQFARTTVHARNAAVNVLKAEKRVKAGDVDRAAQWLGAKKNAAYWSGGPGKAFRKCSPVSAFDWYVLLLVILTQKLSVEVDGFTTKKEAE